MDLINHALRKLRSNPDGVPLRDLLPSRFGNPGQVDQASSILKEFEIAVLHGEFCYRGSITLGGLRKIVRGLNLCLWVLTSRAFERKTVFESREELQRLLDLYAVPAKYTEGLRVSMRFAGVATLAARGLLFYRPNLENMTVAPQKGLLNRARKYSRISA